MMVRKAQPTDILNLLFSCLGICEHNSIYHIEIHVAVDIKKKKILSLQVTTEEVHDGNRLKKLVDNASENNNDVKRVIADDGAYDSKENFRYLFDNGLEAAIKVSKNSSRTSMSCCYPRKVAILEQLKDFKK
jgi:hypothetical protein